ncbi:MAG TPA: ATP-binding protein [Polyangiaceae bacterium]
MSLLHPHVGRSALVADADILAALPQPLLVLDEALTVIVSNPAFERAFVVEPARAVGSPLAKLGDGRWNDARLHQLLAEVLPEQREVTDFEFEADFPGLGRRVLLLNARLIRGAEGPRTILLTVDDVTDRRAAEHRAAAALTALRNKSDQLQEASQELDGITYSLSHDLRAPLRAIDGFCKILAEEHAAALDDEGHRVVGVIRKNATKMGQLIDDLLAFARLGRHPLLKRRCNVTEVARAAADDALALEPERKLELQLDHLPDAECDVGLLRQVFFNLLSNAVKYTRLREDARIRVSGETDDTEVRYVVVDNGVGFEMKYVHKLFGVFQRLHVTSEFEGSGVGLALVQRVVHRHGGRVWAHGQPQGGASFGFSLPKHPASSEATRNANEPE